MRTIRTAKAAAVTVLAAGSLLLGLETASGATASGSQDSGRQSFAGAHLLKNDFGWQ
ncbi:hypothetical protein ACIOHB_21025 [Streptomyces microflavus]|jgi:hypothetical protein|uniref:Uncharacterized protein n=1 Tax=Streptomyces microflavus DSM 40593 TaxID=1303692 RepID=N0CLV3_STRMI|nr:hypothetical protein [Streptomyces microflavus]AGK77116.1 hypothetical protein SFUL_2159 [Streptomyces microflavus DSM 40593]WSS36791.1 hypothetical protein OG269_26585 [Streptomyces microflavus]WST14757.1 hypothetical protein OG721_12555 [Streptomyces microflavus]